MNPPSKAEKEKTGKVEERVEEPPPEEGWMEVGKKNKTVVTRTVSYCFSLPAGVFADGVVLVLV